MSKRVIEAYDAFRDAARRWPDWRLKRVPLGKREKVILPDEQMVLINTDVEPEFGAAQAVSHLDLGHHCLTGRLSTEEQLRAEWLAKLRLDRDESRPPLATEGD